MTLSRRTLLAASLLAPLAARAASGEDGPNVPIEVPVQLRGARVTVALRLGGQGPFDFMIDTGAFAGLIREDLARSLHLAQTGQTRFNGRTLPVYDAEDVIFGGVFAQRHITFAGFGSEGLGRGISGTLSSSLLTMIDSDLDFDRGVWRFYPKSRGAAPAGFTALDSRIAKRGIGSAFLFVHGTLGGRRYRFLLDTGGPGHIQLYREAAKASGLWAPSTPFAPVRTASTNGPGRVSPLVRADVLDLGGGLRFERPLVVLNQTPGMGFPGVDGILGLGLLRHLNLATEVAAGRVWGKINGLAPARDPYGHAGLWFDPVPQGVRVAMIGTGSPAAAAGLQVGDLLPGVDLPGALAMLARPDGTAVPLAIERQGSRQTVTLLLADYL
ncbi:aspartyl protease family protein [uncultured Sphingomonas sp.]|uniref:aspartyl protease family protein n=1 Tax=uncultured Sphingomonas sp. TaxID=158754 RepID=UPI0025E3AC43|nr:aspartyl protease family protein [uncultured Sphingomonas sp.]